MLIFFSMVGSDLCVYLNLTSRSTQAQGSIYMLAWEPSLAQVIRTAPFTHTKLILPENLHLSIKFNLCNLKGLYRINERAGIDDT